MSWPPTAARCASSTRSARSASRWPGATSTTRTRTEGRASGLQSFGVLRNEPLTRGRGRPHVIEPAYRRGGEPVWVSWSHPGGISDERYRGLAKKERRTRVWRPFLRDPEVFAKGTVRHRDHATAVLTGWHRVLMNTEQGARAMRHVAFLD